MLKSAVVRLVMSAALTLFIQSSWAQGGPTSGVYQILSGRYIECCGIGGPFIHSLPNSNQGFVELTVDPQQNLAQMTFLGQDMRTVFHTLHSAPGHGFTFALSNGIVSPGYIQFGPALPPPLPVQPYLSYTASNSADALHIDGTVFQGPICCDIPTHFVHTNVLAVLMSTVTIRLSEVEVCWNAVSNRTYQVQYRSALTTNAWMDLGSPVVGNGSTRCLTDKVPPEQPQRFYRVLTLP